MRLRSKGGAPFSWAAASAWAFSWGLGAALGVAVGAYLTVVGEAGAPGVESLEFGTDFVALPLAALAVVAAVHLAGQVAAALVRGVRSRDDEGRPTGAAFGDGALSDET